MSSTKRLWIILTKDRSPFSAFYRAKEQKQAPFFLKKQASASHRWFFWMSNAAFWFAICRNWRGNMPQIADQYAANCRPICVILHRLHPFRKGSDRLNKGQMVYYQLFTRIAHFCAICDQATSCLRIRESCIGSFMNYFDILFCMKDECCGVQKFRSEVMGLRHVSGVSFTTWSPFFICWTFLSLFFTLLYGCFR